MTVTEASRIVCRKPTLMWQLRGWQLLLQGGWVVQLAPGLLLLSLLLRGAFPVLCVAQMVFNPRGYGLVMRVGSSWWLTWRLTWRLM